MNMKHVYMDEEPGAAGGGGGDPVGEQTTGTAATEPTASKWPDNWRELYSGGDEKKLSHLSRYSTPESAFDGLIATKTKLSSGEYKSTSPFPEKGSDEEKAAWREQNGIPKSANEYKYDNKNLTDDDKEFLASFNEFAHQNNIPASQANSFLGYLLDLDKSESETMRQEDLRLKQEVEDKLRIEWGNDYRRNLNVIHGLLDTAPTGVKDAILGGRSSDGIPLGSNPDVLRFFADLALQVNPVSTLVPTGGEPSKGIQDRIDSIEKMMRENSREYFKDEKIQEEYRTLLDARTRFSKAS